MQKYFYIGLAFLLTLAPTFGYAKEAIDFSKQKMSYALPINAVSKPRVTLSFEPPEGYVASQKNITAFMTHRTKILEYIPKNETFENWTSIITLILALDEKLQSDTYTQDMMNGIISVVKQSKIIKQTTEDHKNYKSTIMALEYTTKEGSTELLYMEYYSGPYDSAGIQLTKKLDHWLDGAEADAEAKKSEEFIKKQLMLV